MYNTIEYLDDHNYCRLNIDFIFIELLYILCSHDVSGKSVNWRAQDPKKCVGPYLIRMGPIFSMRALIYEFGPPIY